MTYCQEELERVVLQAVANDYEEFEMIVHDVKKWMNRVCDSPDASQIEYALMKCIADENVKAYEPSEALHRFIATQADPQKICTHWFYITEQGKNRLITLDSE